MLSKGVKEPNPEVTDRLILSFLVGQDYRAICLHRTDFEDGLLQLLLHFYSFSNPSNLCDSGPIRSPSKFSHSEFSIQFFFYIRVCYQHVSQLIKIRNPQIICS